jgi:NADH dehydrogenase
MLERTITKPLHEAREKTGRERPRVVVVGAGFAGLECARGLADANADVLVIDRKNHHCFQPLLYQVATASLSPADIAWPIRSILSRQQSVNVVMAEVEAVDPQARLVHAPPHVFGFDYLVLATGATHSYFGHPEWAALAPGLKTVEDATRIRSRLLSSFERAEVARSDAERQRELTFVVIGGGPTGVELAGSIIDIACNVLAKDFRRIDPTSARVVLIEAGPRVLAAFPNELSDYAAAALRRMGVELKTGESVVGCEPGLVTTSRGERISASNIVWAAGVRASNAAEWLGAPADRAGRILVDEMLRVKGHDNIFAIGDTAHAEVDGRAVPGLAPAAKQMGRFVAGVIARRTEGGASRFRYRHQGDLATIGRRSAVVAIGRFRLTGFVGWLFWSIVHVYFLIGARNRLTVALNWCWEYLTFQRGARLISTTNATATEGEAARSSAVRQ